MSKLRGYIIGGLVGAALAIGIQAGAAGIVGSKVAGTKDVTLNGKTVGQAVIINNSSYLPVRSLSNALDLGIDLSGGKINLSEQEQSSAASTPSPTATPTPSPSSAPSSTELDDINKQLADLNKQGNAIKSRAIELNAKGLQNNITAAEKAEYAELEIKAAQIKSQIESLEKRKSELEQKPQIFDVVLSG